MFMRTESLAILQNLLKHLGVLSVSVHRVSGPEMKGVCDAVEATAEVWGCSVLQTNNTLVCSPKITFSGPDAPSRGYALLQLSLTTTC